mgnify:CR=1 FL=1
MYIKSTNSTNTLMKEMIARGEPIPDGCIYAGYQTAGRGQTGNGWESEPDKNLLCSILIDDHLLAYPDTNLKSSPFFLNVAVSVAAKTDDDKVFVEALDCRPIRGGFVWILDYLKALEPKSVIIDGAGNQKLLAEAMRRAKIKGAVLPTVKEVVVANAQFEQGVFSKALCHMDQPALKQAAGNCEKRIIGNGGFGYKALKEGIEIALLDSAILAFWACSESKERKRQQVRC